jgi:hypothetical protein
MRSLGRNFQQQQQQQQHQQPITRQQIDIPNEESSHEEEESNTISNLQADLERIVTKLVDLVMQRGNSRGD